jgi:hypothetical protein
MALLTQAALECLQCISQNTASLGLQYRFSAEKRETVATVSREFTFGHEY